MVTLTLPLTPMTGEWDLCQEEQVNQHETLSFKKEASASPLIYSLGDMATEVFLIQIKLRNKESQGSQVFLLTKISQNLKDRNPEVLLFVP